MESDFDKTVKLSSFSERLINLVISMVLAALAIGVAYWIGHYDGLLITLVYWIFSVGAIYALLNGLIGLTFGYALKANTLFWLAFFINIPAQILISSI